MISFKIFTAKGKKLFSMKSILKKYYASLNDWQQGSCYFYGVFYGLAIFRIAYHYLLDGIVSAQPSTVWYSIAFFLFGVGGVFSFCKSIYVYKKVNLGLMIITLLTIPFLGIVLWSYIFPKFSVFG